MLNILVPTDFSPLSKVASTFAVKIGCQLDGNVTFLHVLTITTPVRVSMHEKMKKLEDDMIRIAERDMHKLIKDVTKNQEVPLPTKSLVVRSSDFVATLNKESKRLRSGLIVMGTKGATGLKKTMLGSNTTSVIQGSHIPVLVVPDKARFKGFHDIVYACDMKDPERELKLLLPYAEKFDSVVHLVHVTSSGKKIEELEEKMEKILQKLKAKNVAAVVLLDDDIEAAIEQYMSVNKVSLLAMFTHELTFLERLFDKSMTRKVAFHSSVPLLAFKKRK
ncbi:MAG TPA: universal stress protein [Chryseosolibacter sp.]